MFPPPSFNVVTVLSFYLKKKQQKNKKHQTQFMLVQFSLKPSSVQPDFFFFLIRPFRQKWGLIWLVDVL